MGDRERNTLGLLLSLPVSRLEVVVAKFLGRLLAMCLAVGLGLGASIVMAGEGQREVLGALMWPALLLGAAFLSVGLLVSSTVDRQVTATSVVVAIWFIFVFFYDLGLLGLLVLTDGQVSQETIGWLTFGNPAGLFRVEMMERFAGPEVLAGLGLTVEMPSAALSASLWGFWVAGPVALSALLLKHRKVA